MEPSFPELNWIYKADVCHNFLLVEHGEDTQV